MLLEYVDLRHLIPVCIFALSSMQQGVADDLFNDVKARQFATTYCLDCHNQIDHVGNFDLETLLSASVDSRARWEQVSRRLHGRQMPPPGAARPDESQYSAMLQFLDTQLDQIATEHPDPGRTPTLRRMTRVEYQNAIRDLLAINVDAHALLPPDSASHGFDNITVGNLSPTLLNRYLSAAETISRATVGSVSESPGGDTFRIAGDHTQEEHVIGLPLGTRGGMLMAYNFPQTGIYEIQVRLTRDRNEQVEGLNGTHELDVLIDGQRQHRFTISRSDKIADADVDARMNIKLNIVGGPHEIGVTFVKLPNSLDETKRQPYQSRFNMHRHPRPNPAIYQVSIVGPYDPIGPGTSPSRSQVFECYPKSASEEDECAKRILASLARRAYRRPVMEADVELPLRTYHEGHESGGFETGIERALASILVNPNFLFRIERDPPGLQAATAYSLSDLELASRLSFFLWSSIPDEQLLGAAERGKLHDSQELRTQVKRMLDDKRSQSLVTNFAGQWLYLRNLSSITPDARLFPDFDDNLRSAMREETERFFESVLRENRSELDLLNADYTFLNERLAKHYGIPHIYGSHFRRVELAADMHRGGLLRHGSVLLVTSYATRTSPVIRGHWILQNLLGTTLPPPPANVPALKDNTVDATRSVRQRLAEHRANPQCAVCHDVMDPVGFSLENFDAVGRWRVVEGEQPIDSSGGLPDGIAFNGPDGLEQAILNRPEMLLTTISEKLLTYAIGRGIEPADGAAIRKIVAESRQDGNRLVSLIIAIVESKPFQMRRAE